MADERGVWKAFDAQEISHSVAHHLMAIAQLRQQLGYARVTDVAKRLQITRGAASLMLRNLKARDLVQEDDNRFLLLTARGAHAAAAISAKKQLLERFLRDVLGVSPTTADIDTCKIEHLISDETTRRLAGFLSLIESDDTEAVAFVDRWRAFGHRCSGDPAQCRCCPQNHCILKLCGSQSQPRQA